MTARSYDPYARARRRLMASQPDPERSMGESVFAVLSGAVCGLAFVYLVIVAVLAVFS